MTNNIKHIPKYLRKTFKNWLASDAFRESAVISYYSILSLPGFLIVIIWILGNIFGEQAIQGKIVNEIGLYLGRDTSEFLENMIKNAYLNADEAWYMKIIGIGALLFGATSLFFQLQHSINKIWQVQPHPDNGIFQMLKSRSISMFLIAILSFLMMGSVVLSSVLDVFQEFFKENFNANIGLIITMLDYFISFGIITLLFALLFKILPDVDFSWNAIWIGAIFTALLFNVGKYALAFYFKTSDPASGFGAGGTAILIMIWINYTALILFFGAEFTKVYAKENNLLIKPSPHAVWDNNYIAERKSILLQKILSEKPKQFEYIEDTLLQGEFIHLEKDQQKLKFLIEESKTSLQSKPSKSSIFWKIVTPIIVTYLRNRIFSPSSSTSSSRYYS